MNAQDYYRHARTLGAFSAHECFALAREAAALDNAARVKNSVPFVTISCEVLPDESNPLTLSFGIKVF